MLHLLQVILRPFRDRRIYAEFLGLLLLGFMLALASTRLLDNFENLFLDMRFKLRGQIPFPDAINLIAVDEASLDVFGRWPWPRNVHAELLNALRHKSFRPAVVGYDFLFENKSKQNPESDEALVFRTQNMDDKVVMAYFFEKGPGSSFERDELKESYLEKFALPHSDSAPEQLDVADKVSLPFTELAGVSQLAFVNAPVDDDGRTRRAQLLVRYRDKIYPSMGLLLAFNYLGVEIKDVRLEKRAIVIEKSNVGKMTIPVSAKGNMLINYYGNLDRIKAYSVVEVLKESQSWMKGQEPKLLRSFKDKIVLVGVTALGFGDRRVTPFQQYESGLSLHAQVVANILDQSFLLRPSAKGSYFALTLVAILTIGLATFLRITLSLPSVAGLCLLYFLTAYLFFLKGIWIDIAVQEVTIIFLFIWISAFISGGEILYFRNLAIRDGLTGLFNRRRFAEVLEATSREIKTSREQITIIMADIDHFKRINDTYGHGAGDMVLRGVAQKIQASVRYKRPEPHNDYVVARYGGEEITVMLRNAAAAAEGWTIAERIRKGVEEEQFYWGHERIQVTLSLGVSPLFPEDDSAGVLERADQALYEAKRSGRNRTCLATCLYRREQASPFSTYGLRG